MRALWFFLAGTCGGVLAGMGMGGGTLTIPILVLFLSAGQLAAQFANIVAFLPTGSVALAMHVKNGLVETSALPYVLLPALAAAVVTSAFAREAAEWLGRVYGGFLMLIAAFGLSAGVARNFSSK